MSLRENENVVSFISAAQEYCGILETDCQDAELWVKTILQALSSLYACANKLPAVDISDAPDVNDESVRPSHDDWKAMFASIIVILGDQRLYREFFDPSGPIDSDQEPVVGDIADDLADIYRDIKPGLRLWDLGDDSLLPMVVFDWRGCDFQTHWGCHAVDAMRVLHRICYEWGV